MREILQLFRSRLNTARAVQLEGEEMLDIDAISIKVRVGSTVRVRQSCRSPYGRGWVSYWPSNRTTVTGRTSLDSRTACVFDINARSLNQQRVLTLINRPFANSLG